MFLIHLLSTSQFKLKLYKSECRCSYAIARRLGFGWVKISESYDVHTPLREAWVSAEALTVWHFRLSKNITAIKWLDGISSFAPCHKNHLQEMQFTYNINILNFAYLSLWDFSLFSISLRASLTLLSLYCPRSFSL